MRRTYAYSPIIEVVCEIHFGANSEWDMTIPGLVYEQVRDILPKKQQVKSISIKFQPNSGTNLRETERIQFLSEDGKSFIQVSPHLLAVNHLAPYPSWDVYSLLVKRGYDIYCDITRPTTIERIGLRYINKIPFEEREIDVKKFFNFYPFIGTNLPQQPATFIVGIQTPFADGRDTLKVELTTQLEEQLEKRSLILDLDYTLMQPKHVEPDHVLDWINEAHQHIGTTFEACITDLLREKFDKEG